jgi:hypothetical protein
MKNLFGMTLAAALGVGSLMAPTQAAPVLPLGHASSPIVRVEGGCGDGWHRSGDGYCYRNYQSRDYYGNRRACPPGWHLGEEGRRCWRNY